jgi:predicted transcriptional regulator
LQGQIKVFLQSLGESFLPPLERTYLVDVPHQVKQNSKQYQRIAVRVNVYIVEQNFICYNYATDNIKRKMIITDYIYVPEHFCLAFSVAKVSVTS